MSKPSKSERKENRVQGLEREIVNLKKKNAELQRQKTIQFNDDQLQGFLDELTRRIEWSTNRIVDEVPRSIIVNSQQRQANDVFSDLMKWSIAIPFLAGTIAITYTLCSFGAKFWNSGWANRIALFIVVLAGVDCFALAIDILKEKDRNYIVSLFSALVALVALIVALVK